MVAHPAVMAEALDLPAWKEAGLGGIDFHGPASERDRMFRFEYTEEMFSPLKELLR
jgi:hypothetical protein